ncbi:MAG: methylated-DNA--[protein]-cysteine S-methyltransferase [Acidiferrobacterales bacterium]|nr:methylated-DNA--[protein]-cysteine S-methyltransferase [Acidiferrobacterales bacterium]
MNDYQRIERAIRYLETSYVHQPALSEVAAHVGLSDYHFQRLFRRWAGISPKRFVQYLTAQLSGQLLRDQSDMMDVISDTGLSNPSRLHDLMVNVYAMTPKEYRDCGDSLTIEYGWHPTPFGTCLAGATDKGLCWMSFHDSEEGLVALGSQWAAADLVMNPAKTAELISRIFETDETDKSIMLHLKGTNLQIRVWKALLEIAPGEIVSYSRLASRVERPNAVRAVASAVGRNAISYVIPCHRVLQKGGGIGGYRWGTSRKRAMLTWESANTAASLPVS